MKKNVVKKFIWIKISTVTKPLSEPVKNLINSIDFPLSLNGKGIIKVYVDDVIISTNNERLFLT